jgi:hypothetical protein
LVSRSSGRYVVAAALILAVGIPSVAVGFGEGREARLGKRNPSTSSLTRETQIIANNGSYGTRQSNKRNGDGGGAIYGCRSDTGREPCIRANNLKGGRAFEFNTVGNGEAGAFTVGNETAPPFSTNAKGKVVNLDADKVDGREADSFASADGLLFAQVNADGSLAASKPAPSTPTAPGTSSARTNAAEQTYTVTFPRDVSKCSFTASLTGGSADFSLGVAPVAGQVNQVAVDQRNVADGNADGRPFQLQVIC